MQTSRLILFLALVPLFLLSGTSARADDIYGVTGQLAIAGNNVCLPSPCAETIKFSFAIDEKFDSGLGAYLVSTVPGTINLVASGPLGLFTSGGGFSPVGEMGNTNIDYMALNDSGGDEIDIWALTNLQPAPFTPAIAGSELYICRNATSVADFAPPRLCLQGASECGAYVQNRSLQATVTAVPEPSTTSFTFIGCIFSLGRMRMRLEREKKGRYLTS
jgi:hypothetical protein